MPRPIHQHQPGGPARAADAAPQNDIYTDPALTVSVLQQAAQNDPVFRMFLKWWKQIAVVVLAIGAVVYARSVFNQTYTDSMKRSADLASRVQQSFDQLVAQQGELARLRAAPPAKENEESTQAEIASLEKQSGESAQALEQAIQALGDAREPYRSVALLYRELMARVGAGSAAQTVTPSDSIEWRTDAGAEPAPQTMLVELRALAAARGELDSEAARERGRRTLINLAKEGRFVHVSAALVAARIAATDQERAEVRQVLESLRSTYPEQAALLDGEIARLR